MTQANCIKINQRLRVIVSVCTLGLPAVLKADEAPSVLLKKVEAAMRAAQTVSADYTTVTIPLAGNRHRKPEAVTKSSGSLQIKRPNLLHLQTLSQGKYGSKLEICDGKVLWSVSEGGKQIECQTPGVYGFDISRVSIGSPSFFDPDFAEIIEENKGKLRFLGRQKLHEMTYHVVEMAGQENTFRWFIGTDNLIHAIQADIQVGEFPQRVETVYTRLRTNLPLSKSVFTFAAPPDAKITSIPPLESTMLALNSSIPDVTYPALTGTNSSLPEVCKGSRFTLLNIWAWNCGACHVELPKLQRMYESFKKQGLQVISVHEGLVMSSDPATNEKNNLSSQAAEAYTKEELTRYVRKHQLTFPMLLDLQLSAMTLFKTPGFPSNYLLDSQGKVVFRMGGWDEKILRVQLKRLGVE